MTAARIPSCYGREAGRRPPRHLHHRRRPRRTCDFYAGELGLRHREEDGQPGRPDRLPPLLRRRAWHARAPTSRSSSTRARRAGAPETGWCISIVVPRRHRGGARVLGGRRVRRSAISDRSLVFHDPEGLKLELVVDDSGDAAAHRERAGRSRRSIAIRGLRRACGRSRREPERSARRSCAPLGFDARLDGRAATRASGFYRYDPPPAETGGCRPRARCTTSRGPRSPRSTRRGAAG